MFEDHIKKAQDMIRRLELHVGVRIAEAEVWFRSAEYEICKAFGSDSPERRQWESVKTDFYKRGNPGPVGHTELFSALSALLEEFDWRLRFNNQLAAYGNLPFTDSKKEESVDPLSVITLISSGLKLVDQFRELAIRFRGQQPTPPGTIAEQAGSALEVRHGGTTVKKIDASQLHMDQWDTTRFDALSKRIRTNWNIFNDLFTSEAGASAQEAARIRADMRNVQETLCRDFKEMVGTYERTLGTTLPDHYKLFEVCT